MNINSLISKFIMQICEKQFAYAHSTLSTVVEAKTKEKVKKTLAKLDKKTKKNNMDKKNPKMASKKNK
jgi:hypothetical protein